jgi:hypothetical protein
MRSIFSYLQSDDKVPKEFRQAARSLLNQLHRKKPAAQSDDASAITPEVRAYVTNMADSWHALAATKRPTVVAKQLLKEKRDLPEGSDDDDDD